MNQEFNEFDRVFILEELAAFIRIAGYNHPTPSVYTVTEAPRNTTYECTLKGGKVIDQALLVHKHNVSGVLSELAQREKARHMQELEDKVLKVLRQTIL